jgi:hypothetical protein
MRAWRQIARWESRVEVRKLAGDHGSSGKRMEWKVGKGAIATRWRHEGVGVLAHIPESLVTELLGRIEVRTC